MTYIPTWTRYSCLWMEVMMANKYCKCVSYISYGFEKNWGGTKNLNQNSKLKKSQNSLKKIDRIMCSCLSMEVMMVNKYCKCISYISNGFEKKWDGTKKITKILSGKKAIILTKTLTELCTLVF